MTEDLAQLLQDHVRHDEPPFVPDVVSLIADAHRLRRRRRAAAAGLAAAILIAAGGVAVVLHGHENSGQASDPVLAPYDAEVMPQILADQAGEVFSRSVPDLPPPDFIAEADDGQATQLAPGTYEQAGSMRLSYELSAEHELHVYMAHAKSEVEGDATDFCRAGLEDHRYLSCTVATLADGTVTLTEVQQLVRLGPNEFTQTDTRFARGKPVWFLRTVQARRTTDFEAVVSEYVQAAADGSNPGFTVPTPDLSELADDPALYFPPPN